MSYYCLNAVVLVRNRFLLVGKDPNSSAKHPDSYVRPVTFVETQPILSSRITIVPMSWQILLHRIEVLTMFCVFGTLSCGTGMIWRNFSLLFFCRLSSDCIQILSIANCFCRNRSETVPLLILNSSMIPTSESRQ